ncbi:MAG: hypothetical protein IPI60_04410 [Saprospiraceae bacterium]|nr:hypothetical protein [Saprospiraceae bacterium]
MQNEISQSLKISRVFSIITIVLGLILLIYMIKVEDEPGSFAFVFDTCGDGLVFCEWGDD